MGIKEVMEVLGCSSVQVYRLINQGALPKPQKVHKTVTQLSVVNLFDRDAVMKLKAERG